MKTVKQTMLVVLGLLFFTLISCTHEDYIPVPGPTGADGTNGVNGTTSCETCHSVAHKQPIIDAYALSGHNVGIVVDPATTPSQHVFGGYFKGANNGNTTFDDGSLNSDRAFCSQCHSQEGYIDNAKYGKPNSTGYNNVTSISCEGCHGVTHRSFNFTADGNDFGLRQIAATTQKTFPQFTLNASPTGGKSTANTCVTCHQIRPDANGYYKRPAIESAEVDADPTGAKVVINNTTSGLMYRFWSRRMLAKQMPGYPAGTTNYKTYSNTGTGAHESPQSDTWMGITGVDIEGTTTHLPAAKTAKHYTNNSCVTCHQDTPAPGSTTTGSHTTVVSFQTCATCHTSAANAETITDAFHEDFSAKLENLRKALSAKTAYFKTSSSGSISINFPTVPTVTGSKDPQTWFITREDFPLKYVQAYWNYKMLSSDESKGVHNPTYARALIQNSIEALQ